MNLKVNDHGSGNAISHAPDAHFDNVSIVFHGNNNQITVGSAVLVNVDIEISGNDNQYVISDGASVCNFIVRSKVGVGACRDADRTKLTIDRQVRIEQGQAILDGDDTSIVIGRGTTVVEAKFFAVERGASIRVGENCLFSWNIELRTSDWHSLLNEEGLRINPPAPVNLGSRVWVGSDVRILKGVTVHDEGIIGTGSIVTKDVPSRTAVAGNPARIIKQNVSWSHEAWYKSLDYNTAAQSARATARP
ncbi:acyltransferase [Burkholderia stagnalis]|uniref:acyltransferase n=1 Tax=Burkholderia stagnalis TaxID=1503054 RepID=UPI000A71A0FF|nr:acyltransferase [Burkholderia stagnalis]